MKSRLKSIVAFTLASVLWACAGASPSYQVVRLPSGKEIKVFGVGRMHFSEGGSALMLKYHTDLRVDDKSVLQREIDEIWVGFKKDVENAQLSAAIISASEPRKGGFISTNKSFNFVFKK